MPAEVYSAQEITLLISAWDPTTLNGARNRAMIGLFYGCGLRLNEALSIRPKDIDLQYGAVRVLFAKHGLSRTVGIDRTSAELVAHWIEMQYDLGFIPGTPLICSKYGTKLGKSGVYETLRRAARRVGLNRRIHPHGFRHSMAYTSAMDGVPIPSIRRLRTFAHQRRQPVFQSNSLTTHRRMGWLIVNQGQRRNYHRGQTAVKHAKRNPHVKREPGFKPIGPEHRRLAGFWVMNSGKQRQLSDIGASLIRMRSLVQIQIGPLTTLIETPQTCSLKFPTL
jgi:integrase